MYIKDHSHSGGAPLSGRGGALGGAPTFLQVSLTGCPKRPLTPRPGGFPGCPPRDALGHLRGVLTCLDVPLLGHPKRPFTLHPRGAQGGPPGGALGRYPIMSRCTLIRMPEEAIRTSTFGMLEMYPEMTLVRCGCIQSYQDVQETSTGCS